MTAAPRFHTPRDPSRRTLGGKLAKLAALMGTPLMPWQRMAADVALELDPDGRFHYKRVIITVPRQSGKTTMTLALGLHRTLTVPDGKVWYTAQTGQSARERFIGDLVPPATKILGGAIEVKKGAGDTRLTFPPIGSQFRPHPPNDEYLHGEQSDLNLIDEPWAFSEIKGDALIQALKPTQNTRPNAQTVYLSTMGDARSTWWHSIVDNAREGNADRTCICDWGLPESADPSDIEAVIDAHPAVGHTIEPQAIYDAAADMKLAEFARAYANIRTQTRVSVFPADVLKRAFSDDAMIADDSPVAFGVAVSWTRDRAVIASAGYGADGVPVVEIVDTRPGSAWCLDAIPQLNKHNPLKIMVDARSPASTIAADPDMADHITIPDSRTIAAGTAGLTDRINDGTIYLKRDSELGAAFDALALKTVGDLGSLIDRKHSAGSVAHIEAVMLALAGLEQAPAPAPQPMIWS